jgi:hypothetical protein|tara:strand:- start:34 stop:339 length:306 start_codon:yes stop_codon:yes gene_type:complete
MIKKYKKAIEEEDWFTIEKIQKKKKTQDHWIDYHATRLNLIQSIDSHFESISKVNVYNSGSRTDIRLNTSGDHSLMNESMGTIEMKKLKDKLFREGDEGVL